jgi:hypothetical protein
LNGGVKSLLHLHARIDLGAWCTDHAGLLCPCDLPRVLHGEGVRKQTGAMTMEMCGLLG